MFRALGFTAGFFLTLPTYAQTTQMSSEKAEAKLEAKNKSSVKGSVTFEPTAEGMKVSYKISGLRPNQKHGFHLHEKGDCSSVDAKSAGPHFAKLGPGRGTSKDFPEEYAGDFPELQANEKGVAAGDFVMPRLSSAGEFSVLDRAVIVHENHDDVTKKSAARIACGVVKR